MHAATTLSQAGFETVMVNCNPETVSTDYDTADRLYFEPLTFEDVLEVFHAENQSAQDGPGVVGVIVQLGGQTPLGLAQRLADAGVPIVGTPPEAINLAEDRGAFGDVLATAGLPAPRYGTATTFDQARRIAAEIGYPVLVRPSYVLGGRGMEIVYDEETLEGYITRATELSPSTRCWWTVSSRTPSRSMSTPYATAARSTSAASWSTSRRPGSTPATPRARCPGDIGPHRHREGAQRDRGHRPRHRRGGPAQCAIRTQRRCALRAGGQPRASRTVPFVSKATAVPLAKACARIMLGANMSQLRNEGMLAATGDGATAAPDAPIAVKEAVLPFHRFRTVEGAGIDSLLGPEMKSTGEVMGIDRDFGSAFAKSQTAAYGSLPAEGTVFVSVANRDKRSLVFPVKRLADLGFRVLATEGTAEMLRRNGIPCEVVRKHFEKPRPDRPALSAVDAIRAGEVDMVINTPTATPVRASTATRSARPRWR
ncbi:MGS-like domain protein [Mycobacterium xenopi 3993]|nr:MGS-like domain protein [Mycobacterium xenopi 3993]